MDLLDCWIQVCYSWEGGCRVQNHFSCHLLSKIVKRTTILFHSLCCRCITWSFTLREVHRLWVCECRVIRKYLDVLCRKWCVAEGSCIMTSCILCILDKILSGWWNQGGWDRIHYSANCYVGCQKMLNWGQILSYVPRLSSN